MLGRISDISHDGTSYDLDSIHNYFPGTEYIPIVYIYIPGGAPYLSNLVYKYYN